MSNDSKEWDTKLLGGSIKRNIVNPDILEERAKCNFDKQEMLEFVISKPVVDEIKEITDAIAETPELQSSIQFYNYTRNEQHEYWWRIINAAYKHPVLGPKHFLNNSNRKTLAFCWSYMFMGVSILHLHQSMFTKSIVFLASEEQKARWLDMVNKLQIIGCYAQTELGHGSNVAGLETTATLDKETDEFVIHTPSIRATKFWPGSLGRISTHAIVMANLIVDGNRYGVQAFLVPIRSRENHMPFPGIEVGDIGNKLGYNSVDNGYLSFNNYRVPRLSMLSRFASVNKEGEFELLGDPRSLYQIMTMTRTMIIFGSSLALARSVSTATRYAVCRRQFKNEEGVRRERKIIDYQTHMQILGPHMANALLMNVTGAAIEKLIQQSNAEVEKGSFKLLDIIHHFTSGLKSLCTEMCYRGTDECRSSCGGQGFHVGSGMVHGFTDHATLPTFEGVNVLMYQQSSRYLLKLIKKAKAGKKMTRNFVYMNNSQELLSSKSQAKNIQQAQDLDYLQKCLEVRCSYHNETTYNLLQKSDASFSVKQNDLFALDIEKMAKHHTAYILFSLTRNAVDSHKFNDPNVLNILYVLMKVYCLKQIQDDTQGLYECGFFSAGSGQLINEALKDMLRQLRPQMIPLAELDMQATNQFKSASGNFHGDIFEHMLDFAKGSELNSQPVPTYYEKYMKPLIQSNGDGGKFKL